MRSNELSATPGPAHRGHALDVDALQRRVVRSPTVARIVIAGLPGLGILASLCAQLPLFATLMAGAFLLATALVCRTALVLLVSQTLRLLLAARLVILLVLAALLFCCHGSAWMGLVSALLVWLVSDRLLGRYALDDLCKLVARRS